MILPHMNQTAKGLSKMRGECYKCLPHQATYLQLQPSDVEAGHLDGFANIYNQSCIVIEAEGLNLRWRHIREKLRHCTKYVSQAGYGQDPVLRSTSPVRNAWIMTKHNNGFSSP